MPWGRVDDQHYRHEKLAELDEDLRKGCICLYWLAISWCNDRLTDGRVPRGTVRILGGDAAEADELVRVGLWEKDGTGYRVHDYLHFNKSRSQVEEERVQRSAAGLAGARARWHPDSDPPSGPVNDLPSDADSEPNGGRDAPVSRTPSPVTPSPEPAARASDDRWDAPEFEALQWLARHGCDIRPGNGYHRKLVTAVEVHGATALIGMMDRLASAGTKPGDTKGFLFGAIDALDAANRPRLVDVNREENREREAESVRRRVERTKRSLHELGHHQDALDPQCPSCRQRTA